MREEDASRRTARRAERAKADAERTRAEAERAARERADAEITRLHAELAERDPPRPAARRAERAVQAYWHSTAHL